MESKEIYLIPGLGFDCRIFRNLDFGVEEVRHLDWIEPHGDEPLARYAGRMAAGFAKNNSRKIIVGHSFGGLLAQEIAKIHAVETIVLISSIKSGKENSWIFRATKWLRLHRFFTKELALKTFPYWAKKHGYESEEERGLFIDMVKNHSDHYLKWALKTLSHWDGKGTGSSIRVIQIHGELDKTFPICRIAEPVIRIPGGTHFMVFNKAGIIGPIIESI